MTIRERIAYFVCPVLKEEVAALRSGNTRVVLENQRLLDRLSEDDYIELPDALMKYLPDSSRLSLNGRRIRIPDRVGGSIDPK